VNIKKLDGTRYKIFVIDDSPTGLLYTQTVLESEGYIVHGYTSSIGIVHAYHKLKPDMIIIDVNMPVIRGDQTCRLIRAVSRGQGPLIILHSSDTAKDLCQLASECSADGFVCKSESSAALTRAVYNMFSRAAEAGAVRQVASK
jgi:CheY-like chemotaxis protein